MSKKERKMKPCPRPTVYAGLLHWPQRHEESCICKGTGEVPVKKRKKGKRNG